MYNPIFYLFFFFLLLLFYFLNFILNPQSNKSSLSYKFIYYLENQIDHLINKSTESKIYWLNQYIIDRTA